MGHPSQCSCSLFNMCPPSLNKPLSRPQSCHAHRSTPKATQHPLRTEASCGACGCRVESDVISKEVSVSSVSLMSWPSPHQFLLPPCPQHTHVIHVLCSGAWHPVRCVSLSRKQWRIYCVESGCVLDGIGKWCLPTVCEVVANIKEWLLW